LLLVPVQLLLVLVQLLLGQICSVHLPQDSPLQPSVQVKYAPSEQELCERKIDQDDQEPLEIKEEQEENLRSAPA
ncbi:hypothetical protein KUCAC02_001883, partial [Chaenocephalus aceratus]